MLEKIYAGFEEADIVGGYGVIVFTFSVNDFAEGAAVTYTLHFAVKNHLRVVFCKHIN